MPYVDLHSHLLPGIDDGATTMADAVAHAWRLHADGVRDLVCTPHVKHASFPRVALDELAARVRATQRAIDAAGPAVRLHPGGELAHPDALVLAPAELDLIAQGPDGARWLLLECPFAGIHDDFLAAAERLSDLGYGLLLAHPERAATGLERLRPLLEDGVLLQVNVSSLLGGHGARAREAAERLIRHGLAHCLASDAHPGTREDTLRAGHAALRRAGATDVQAARLTRANPRFLLREGIPQPFTTPIGRSWATRTASPARSTTSTTFSTSL